jgi:uncharacterized protein YhbP (UPF0306 family)
MNKKVLVNNIVEFVKNNSLMTLGVIYKKMPHLCTLHYATADGQSLYFISKTDAIHSKIIEKDEKVGIAIFDHENNYSQNKAGAQLLGSATRITNFQELVEVRNVYVKTIFGAKQSIPSTEELTAIDPVYAFYKVEIKVGKYYDIETEFTPSEYVNIVS